MNGVMSYQQMAYCKTRLDWICKTWIVATMSLPIHKLKIIRVYLLSCTFCALFRVFAGCTVFTIFCIFFTYLSLLKEFGPDTDSCYKKSGKRLCSCYSCFML